MKTITPQIISIAILTILSVPFVSGAASVRTEHRASSQSGGVSVSGGSAVVTGDEHSSVSVQNVVTGTQGRVQITTVQDGVQTTETYTIPASGDNGTVIVSPVAPQTPVSDDRRPPRESRTVVSVQAKSTNSATVSAPVRQAQNTSVRTVSLLAIAREPSTGMDVVTAYHMKNPSIVPSVQQIQHVQTHSGSNMIPESFSQFFTRMFAVFGMSLS